MRVEINAYFRAHPDTGSGQYLIHLADALRRGFPDVHLSEHAPGHSSSRRLGKVAWEQVQWPRRARRADVRHVPYLAPPIVDPRSVVTAHDVIPFVLDAYGAGAGQRLYRLLVRLGIRRSERVIADSAWTGRDLERRLDVPADRIRVVPLGVDSRFGPGESGDSRGSDVEGLPSRFALYLGSLDRRKNLGVLLRAWPRVWAECGVPLVVYGRSPRPGSRVFVDWFRGQDIDSAPWLEVRGPLDERRKPAVFRAASLFVFPSRYEGFGLEPLEAMASGVPVVAADATSLPEVVGEAGMLVPPDSDDGWADAAIRVLQDRGHAERLRAAGLERARTFTWERTAAATYEIYTEVAR